MMKMEAEMSSEMSVSYYITTQRHDLKMEAEMSSEMSVSYYITTQRHNPEDRELNIHRRGNVQSHNRNVKIYRTLQEAG
jgi:hypothetical protein